ncbi:MAG TPA: heme o synthase [Chloroflexota bacterium]|nr:heme o synthase [Chloroflexota bacterium]
MSLSTVLARTGGIEAVPPAALPVRIPLRSKLLAYLALTKPRVIVLLEVPTLAAMLVAREALPSIELVLVTLLGGALAAGGAAAINCYLDRDIDALMGDRTKQRPIPAGLVTPREALGLGSSMGVLAFGLLAWRANLLAAGLALAALLFYVVVYTRLLKRTTPSNIVIGGAAGAIPPLVGWAAVAGRLDPPAWLLFALVFFWTPPHFWALSLLIQKHYARAKIPMLPVVRGERETHRQILLYTVQMIAVSVLLPAIGFSGWFYLVSALVLGAGFLWLGLRLQARQRPADAALLFKYSIYYLWVLSAALVLDQRVFI